MGETLPESVTDIANWSWLRLINWKATLNPFWTSQKARARRTGPPSGRCPWQVVGAGRVEQAAVIRFRLITLDEITFRQGEVTKVAFHPVMLLFYAGLVCFLILLDANGTRERISGASHILAYVAGAASALAFIVLGLKFGEAKAKATGQDVLVNGSLTCFGGALVAMLVGEAVATAIAPKPMLNFIEGIVLAVFYYGLIELVMVFLTAYILPRVQAAVRAGTNAAPVATINPPAPLPANLTAMPRRPVTPDPVAAVPPTLRSMDAVRVGSARFAPADIRRVEAEGNYVRIVTPTARVMLPGPFSQVVEQLPDAAGQVVNRSCWIAAGAIVAHRRERRDLFVLLDDGTEVKVAATRRDAVMAWLRGIGQMQPRRTG